MKSINFGIKCVKSEITDLGSIHEQFVLNYLNQNQALTVGGLLRRTLLNEIGGTAITAIKISGIDHEFSTIKGIREDILEILLNLKGVILKNKNKFFKKGYLKISGPAIITANCIKFDSGIEIINPNHYIATIDENITVDMEFLCEYGLGYKLANQGFLTVEHVCFQRNSKNFLETDAIFMPVQKVNVSIENYSYDDPSYLNSPLYKNKEKLVLDIWTNGSISPRDVLKESIEINLNLFQQLLENDIVNSIDNNLIGLGKTKNEIYNNISLEQLKLSIRTYNALKQFDINNVCDILKYSSIELKKIKNLGKKSFNEIFNLLKNKFGITLK